MKTKILKVTDFHSSESSGESELIAQLKKKLQIIGKRVKRFKF
jgi:hypothetical protein